MSSRRWSKDAGSTELSKREQRRLRELAGLAHERALGNALDALRQEFERWTRKEIDAFELSDKIHEFHNRTGRKIYSFYVGADPQLVVARAIVDGVLSREEVGDELMTELERMIETFRKL
jgi:hypothetical protein